MTDAHAHLERGSYIPAWAAEFAVSAKNAGITELCLLEHSYLFPEFLPLYDDLRRRSPFIDRWLSRKGGTRSLDDYLRFTETVRSLDFGLPIRFGLEVCFLPGQIVAIERLLKTLPVPLDFAVGSIHFIGDLAFDHTPELWDGVNVDRAYRQFFGDSVRLAESGVFDGLAHPDSLKLFGHRPTFGTDELEEWYDRLAEALAGAGMYAEQNSGISRRTSAEAGMAPALYAAMKRHSVRICTASDAHCPADVGKGVREFYESGRV